MIKSDLVARIAAHNPHLYNRDVEKVVNAILNQIVSAMTQGNRVELPGIWRILRSNSACSDRPRSSNWDCCTSGPKGHAALQSGEGNAESSQLDCNRC
jgi:hypothetical protein